jgi:hypothetical protein
MDDRAAKMRLIEQIQLARGLYEVKLRPRRRTRTLEQNAYYWAAFISPFADWLRREWGQPINLVQAHEVLKRAVMGVRELLHPETGEVIEVPLDTRFMDTEEFSVYLDQAALWLAAWCEIIVLSSDMFAESAPEPSKKKSKPAKPEVAWRPSTEEPDSEPD